MKKVLTLIISLSLFTACAKKNIPTVATKTEVKDSTVTIIKETVRVDTVTIAGDTITTTIHIECPNGDKPTVSPTETKSIRAFTGLKDKGNGNYILYGGCAEMKQTIAHKDSIISQYQAYIEKYDVKINDTKECPATPKIYVWSLWILIGLGLWKILKFVLQFYNPLNKF